jgi:predicted nucleic acid-binding protein
MRVVDTSIWIEWLIGGAMRKKLATEFPDRENCIVPTIVQLELAKWLKREVGEDQADTVLAYTQKCFVAPLDTRTALRAAEVHRAHKLATANAIVIATALETGADLLTCDAHFEHLPSVRFVRKPFLPRKANARRGRGWRCDPTSYSADKEGLAESHECLDNPTSSKVPSD